jgi:hypothetical protein
LLVDVGAVLDQQLCDLDVVPFGSQVKSGLIFPTKLSMLVTNVRGCLRETHTPMALGSAPFSSSSVAILR